MDLFWFVMFFLWKQFYRWSVALIKINCSSNFLIWVYILRTCIISIKSIGLFRFFFKSVVKSVLTSGIRALLWFMFFRDPCLRRKLIEVSIKRNQANFTVIRVSSFSYTKCLIMEYLIPSPLRFVTQKKVQKKLKRKYSRF